MKERETIRTACVLTDKWIPIFCKRHGEWIRIKKQLYWEWTTQKQQGFRTSESRFVSRREAFKIAKAAWQLRIVDWITGEVINWQERLDVLGENDLYSEDLR